MIKIRKHDRQVKKMMEKTKGIAQKGVRNTVLHLQWRSFRKDEVVYSTGRIHEVLSEETTTLLINVHRNTIITNEPRVERILIRDTLVSEVYGNRYDIGLTNRINGIVNSEIDYKGLFLFINVVIYLVVTRVFRRWYPKT